MRRKIKLFVLSLVIIIIGTVLILILINKIKIYSAIKKAENIVIGDNTNIINNIDNPVILTEDTNIGTLTIPSILLNKAPINEGIELETLSHSIGHFPSTSIYNGNVGFASHNSGNADYFKELYKLDIGDVIYYESIYGTKRYLVEKIIKIHETDFSYLESTTNNRLTLITCVNNTPELRLCVQAKEF